LKIGILTIATGHYLKYWCEMIASAELNLNGSGHEICFHVFTERHKEVEELTRDFRSFEIKSHEIPGYGWPEATLFRYKIIEKFRSHFQEDVLMHLDADMLVRADFLKTIEFNELVGGIGLVAHPGFWRPTRARGRMYLQNPKMLISDIRRLITYGSLGSWETRKQSSAYVRRSNRQQYVCGGFWLGMRNEFLSLVTNCAEQVEYDDAREMIAVWHDESHLNRWAAENMFTLLTPAYCYDPAYPQLASLRELIRAVDKRE
jgi:hypothetical protein